MVKLKKCPFCGSDAHMYGPKIGWNHIVCTNGECGCRTPLCRTEEEAAWVWNRRVEE